MKWIILPCVWLLAMLVAVAVLYRLWRGQNVVLHGRWKPRVVRAVVVILVVLGVGADPATSELPVPPAPQDAGKPDDLAASGLSIDSLRAWDTMVRQGNVTRFKQAFVQRQLRATLAGKVTPEHIARLIEKLDANTFAERQKAFAELESILPLAVDALRQAAAANPPLEKLQRIEKLLEQVKALPPLEQARALVGVFPQTMRLLLLADLDALDKAEPAPRLGSRAILQCLEELERVGMIDPWLHAYLWRKAGEAADRDCQAELFSRLHRHARLANALIRARAEAIRPIQVSPRAWMSKAGPGRDIRLEEQQQFADLVQAVRKHYPTSDTGTWQKDAVVALIVAQGSTPLKVMRGSRSETLAAGAELRFQRLDLIDTGAGPALLEHTWLGRIELPAKQLISVWDLPEHLQPAAKQEVQKRLAAALAGDEKAATQLEQTLPLVHAAVRQGLANEPTAVGAPRLRLILALFDDTLTASSPWKSGPAKHPLAIRERLE